MYVCVHTCKQTHTTLLETVSGLQLYVTLCIPRLLHVCYVSKVVETTVVSKSCGVCPQEALRITEGSY